MQKNIQVLVDELDDLKKGVHKYSTKWTAMPVTEAQLQTAIDTLKGKSDNIEAAEVALKQARSAGRTAVEQTIPLAEQTTSLAEGIHKTTPDDLADYNISIITGRKAKSIPAKAVIAAITDDEDGVGFVIRCQSLDQAEGFEIEKSHPVDSTTAVLAPPYTHLKNHTKLIYIDDEVEKGKRYFYRIRGYNRRGYGEWSESVSRVQ
jgi:hypothetical protein